MRVCVSVSCCCVRTITQPLRHREGSGAPPMFSGGSASGCGHRGLVLMQAPQAVVIHSGKPEKSMPRVMLQGGRGQPWQMKGGPRATDKALLMFADGALDDRAWKVKSQNYREI